MFFLLKIVFELEFRAYLEYFFITDSNTNLQEGKHMIFDMPVKWQQCSWTQ